MGVCVMNAATGAGWYQFNTARRKWTEESGQSRSDVMSPSYTSFIFLPLLTCSVVFLNPPSRLEFDTHLYTHLSNYCRQAPKTDSNYVFMQGTCESTSSPWLIETNSCQRR